MDVGCGEGDECRGALLYVEKRFLDAEKGGSCHGLWIGCVCVFFFRRLLFVDYVVVG